MEHFSQTCSHKALYNQHDKDYIDILQSELIYRVEYGFMQAWRRKRKHINCAVNSHVKQMDDFFKFKKKKPQSLSVKSKCKINKAECLLDHNQMHQGKLLQRKCIGRLDPEHWDYHHHFSQSFYSLKDICFLGTNYQMLTKCWTPQCCEHSH